MAFMNGTAEAADARLQEVLQRLDTGQPITVAAIGGSITTGYAADPPRERGWAAQVAAWLGRRGNVRFVNAGAAAFILWSTSRRCAVTLQKWVPLSSAATTSGTFAVASDWIELRGPSFHTTR